MADLADGSGSGTVGELRRLLREARDAIAFLRSSTDLIGRATVEAGKDFAVRGLLKVLGNVSMISQDGFELFRLGDMEFGRGLEFKRDDGSPALRFRKPFVNSDVQALELYDRVGQVIVSEAGFGFGLGRPYLAHPVQPAAAASGTAVVCGPYGFERTTTSGTFETLFVYDGKAQNPFLDFKFAAMCSDGSTAGELQVVDLDSGLPLPGALMPAWLGAIPTGTTTMTIIDPLPTQVALPVTGDVGGQIRIGVQCRRTAGAGTITISVAQAIGG